jgi:2-aminoadipate transaminase
MSYEKRKAVYALAKKYGVLILEDNPYGELRFSGEEIPTIKSLDDEGIVIYCGSFSKILSAGIRVGFVQAPDDIIQKIVVAKQVSDVHSNLFFQILAYRFMAEYDFNGHIEKIKALYRHKSSLMISNMEQHLDKSFEFIRPEGGLFIWCKLPDSINMPEYCKKSAASGVAVVPGIAFAARTTDYFNAVRLNYSTPTDEQIVKGVEILGKIK